MKTEIISKINELTQQDAVLPLSRQFGDLTDQFYTIIKEEERVWELKKLELIEAGEKAEAIEKPVDEAFDNFKSAVSTFKAKRQTEIDLRNESEGENLTVKTKIIKQLSDLVANEEHIGKAITTIKEIQTNWKAVGAIPRDKRQSIDKEYSNLMDEFRYNINIYKEIADNDRVKNLGLKKEVIAELKTLLEVEKIRDVETKLHNLQNIWNEIGGTHQDQWEAIKEEYYGTVNTLYERIKAFYDNRREEQKGNILLKIVLIEKVMEINKVENESHQDFQKTTEQILALQEEWKTIGFGPKAENDKVWAMFRGECNLFFDKKKVFYNERNSKFDGLKVKKEALIVKVEALKESTDWKDTTFKLVDIQKEWKNIGSAGPKFDNQLWNVYRKHVDFFFDAKDAHFKGLDEANAGNLKLKKELIEKLTAYEVGKDVQKIIADLKVFSEDFKSIGNVPFAVKDKIYEAYRTALDEKYNQIDLGKEEKAKVLYQGRLDAITSSANPERGIDEERFTIRQKMDEFTQEKAQLENNLSFFANAKDDNPLLVNARKSISNVQQKIDGCKAQLKMLSVLSNTLQKAKAIVEENTVAENE
jgi:uncharacterized protein (UPF0262 family)